MNKPVDIKTLASACPHDCPSTCALEVEVVDGTSIGRVRGAKDNTYTDGVICAKVARYSERIHSPDRITKPLMQIGEKGSDNWQEVSWDDALDHVAERLMQTAQTYGSEAVWPYVYAGTMGLVQRDSIHRLRHAMRWSKQYDTICITPAWTGFAAGTGTLMGPDPREMGVSDCVVIWGTNAVNTQINVMTHAMKARKHRGAKIVVVDVYQNDTMKQADLALCLRPGTDAALACAVMHCLFRDGHADRDFMRKFSDVPDALESHLQPRTPQWASEITGLTVEEIEAFAALLAQRPRAYLRLGYGFTRSRNGAVAMHAAQSIATVLGSWQYEGGGAFHTNAVIFKMDSSEIKGASLVDPSIRTMDQSKIGRVLTGDAEALQGGPPVHALLIQNTNPANIAPEQKLVRKGLARSDLFTVVHEQFMTETAQMADVVLPATMFMEHDDIYRGGGHQYIILGPKLIDGPGETRPNLFVVEELAKRLGVSDKPGFGKTANELIDGLLRTSNRGSLEDITRDRWVDCQPSFDESHFVDGFAYPDGKYRFAPDWTAVPWGAPPTSMGLQGAVSDMPTLPDQWDVTEVVDTEYPFRLATSPSRSFLNSTFAETAGSKKREGEPTVMIHPDDAHASDIADKSMVALSNQHGEVWLRANVTDKAKRGVLIAEGLHPNKAHKNGWGINVLTSADTIAPHGGAAFHDTRVALRALAA
ncbi:MAG: molybdopterin oxidoreductase family protein [Pseudomonadota bacterium]